VSVTADQLQPGALCTLLDVAKRVPGYSIGEDGELDEILSDLIIQESADLEETTGREIAATDAGVTRVFDLTPAIVSRRTLPVGDLTTATKVELFDYDETTSLGIIDPGLYVFTPRVRPRPWRPYTRLTFPYRPTGGPILLAPGRVVKITGTWGFPEIPTTIARAVAVFTIFRYLNDVAASGTPFAELASQEDVNLAASLRAALDARDRLRRGPFA